MKRILVLSWHPKNNEIIAGGFKRAVEIINRAPADFNIDIIDTFPSLFKNNTKINSLYEYKIPMSIKKLEDKLYIVERMLEFIFTSIILIFYALKLQKSKKYDVIYVPCGELNYISFSAIIIKFLFKNKVVLTQQNIEIHGKTMRGFYSELRKKGYSLLHSLLLPPLTYAYRFCSILLYNKADVIITVSKDLKNKLMEFGVKTKIEVVYNGVDYEYIQSIPNQEKKYEGIFIGRHEPEKGIFDLIEVWKYVVKSHPKAKLILIGLCEPSVKKKIKQKLMKYNLNENIILYGVVSEGKKIKYLKQSKIIVFLSKIEGWGLVPIEGLACGLPVVAYDLSVYKENIKNCDAAFLVPIGDYKSAADKVIEFFNKNEKEISELSEKAKKFASIFNWNKTAIEEFEIIKGV